MVCDVTKMHGVHSAMIACTQIRTQISREFVQDLQAVAEENAILLRETLSVSLSLDATAAHPLESESDLEASRDEDDRY